MPIVCSANLGEEDPERAQERGVRGQVKKTSEGAGVRSVHWVSYADELVSALTFTRGDKVWKSSQSKRVWNRSVKYCAKSLE